VAHQSNYAIRSAIECCLARCRQSEQPLGCLEEALESLRERLWHEQDVAVVEATVLKILLRVLATRYVDRYEVV
jgi:hypothetical protein